MNSLHVKNVQANKDTLTVEFECVGGNLKKHFVKNQFITNYDSDISLVPQHILTIPFLASVATVCWANKADIYLDVVDGKFLQSLNQVKATLNRFYPKVGFAGNIITQPINYPAAEESRSMILFSGGVDSLATYIRHRNEKPILICVHGADIAYDNIEGWQNSLTYTGTFAKHTGAQFQKIRSNFRSILDPLMLGSYDSILDGGWWQRVMHGLALTGLCAPVTYRENVAKLYIASTWTAQFSLPCGSDPSIDNNIAWGKTRVIHDGYELSRQDKLAVIAHYANTLEPKVLIRCCYHSDDGTNCCVCEKCSRTIVGLTIAGLNPENHGFKINPNTFAAIKENIVNDKWHFGENEKYMWIDLQSHIDSTVKPCNQEAERFLNWLKQLNLQTLKFEQQYSSKAMLSKVVNPTFKYLPSPVYVGIRQLYVSVKNTRSKKKGKVI